MHLKMEQCLKLLADQHPGPITVRQVVIWKHGEAGAKSASYHHGRGWHVGPISRCMRSLLHLGSLTQDHLVSGWDMQ